LRKGIQLCGNNSGDLAYTLSWQSRQNVIQASIWVMPIELGDWTGSSTQLNVRRFFEGWKGKLVRGLIEKTENFVR
jgi:hypothetical protein